jgi:hypothetical protein
MRDIVGDVTLSATDSWEIETGSRSTTTLRTLRRSHVRSRGMLTLRRLRERRWKAKIPSKEFSLREGEPRRVFFTAGHLFLLGVVLGLCGRARPSG